MARFYRFGQRCAQFSVVPNEDGGEVECGLVGEGEFAAPCGQAAPLLEAVVAAFDGVALLVCLGVEARWAPSIGRAPPSAAHLTSRL
jgi:hypothetical protein